jgi:xanthine dehydrogenase molybdopterin-binding subunit B
LEIMRRHFAFLRRESLVRLDAVSSTPTLLDYLRLDERAILRRALTEIDGAASPLAPDRAAAARGWIVRIALEAERKAPSVVAALIAADISGRRPHARPAQRRGHRRGAKDGLRVRLADFRIALFDGPNREVMICRSKAIGEPPLMLAISVFVAIADAIHSWAPGAAGTARRPATPESILHALGALEQH